MTAISPFIFILYLFALSSIHAVEVTIRDGALEGDEAISYGGRKYYRFRSIPYADPPIGELRFENPQPLTPWTGILNATDQGPSCMQYGMGYEEGQEDCLYLNVYTPYLPSEGAKKSLPVLVWIHGGAFIAGSSRDYNPSYLMDRDVVLVIPQYRVGLMGFYYTVSEYGLGNYGLHDQVAALRWVQKNIHQFGGYAGRVTLGGDCAGAASAISHMMTPLSEGLFHGVIAISGTPLNPWALHSTHRRLEMMIANGVVCPIYDSKLWKKCFKKKNATKLMEVQQDYVEQMDLFIGNAYLGIAVQDHKNLQNSTEKDTFIMPKHPVEYLITKNYAKVPVLMGVPNDIGSFMVDTVLYEAAKTMEKSRLDKMINGIGAVFNLRSPDESTELLKNYYVPDYSKNGFNKSLEELALMFGDLAYNTGIIETAKLLSEEVPTRLYRFNYMGFPKLFELRHPDKEEAPPMKPAVSLGDDVTTFLPYIYSSDLTPMQIEVKESMLDMIENFMHKRETETSWPLFDAKEMKTNVMNEEGKWSRGERFCSTGKEKILSKIFNYQFAHIIEKISEELGNEKPSHTEL